MVRTRATARCFYAHEASSARLVSKITFPFIISVQDTHQWMGQLHVKSSEVWYPFRAPIQSAHILQAWSQQVYLVLQAPVWWPSVRSEGWRVWNEHLQGNQMTRQLFCYLALAVSSSHDLDTSIEKRSCYSWVCLILLRLVQQKDVSLFQWKSETFPMHVCSSHPCEWWPLEQPGTFPHGWPRVPHLLIPVLQVSPVIRDLLGSTKWRKCSVSSTQLLPELLTLKAECGSWALAWTSCCVYLGHGNKWPACSISHDSSKGKKDSEVLVDSWLPSPWL